MPKKKKISEKDAAKKEEILKELAESLKSKKAAEIEELDEKSGEESELEEDIDSGFRDLEFQQFMSPVEKGRKPVLERIAESQPRPLFVGTIPQGVTAEPSGNGTNGDDFKYMPGTNNREEPKYLESDSHISIETRRIDTFSAGRQTEPFSNLNQQAFFEGASEIKQRGFESQRVERFERAERFDTERAGRQNTFEREEVKYEKYKPKLPKSY